MRGVWRDGATTWEPPEYYVEPDSYVARLTRWGVLVKLNEVIANRLLTDDERDWLDRNLEKADPVKVARLVNRARCRKDYDEVH
jgi:hypothetical protein